MTKQTNFKLTIAYDGSRYQGWQRLKKAETVQSKLEECLSKLADETVEIVGSGRTDAGVHAQAQVANFHTAAKLTPKQIMDDCLLYLPKDIIVTAVEEVPPRFHARYNAKRKTYVYRVWNAPLPDVFQRRTTWHVPESLNVGAMRRAAQQLVGKHDFRSFTNTKGEEKSTVRTIYALEVTHTGPVVELTFEADGFLYNMARILAGTLVDAGRGTIAPEAIPGILKACSRAASGPIAPPQGLFLMDVVY